MDICRQLYEMADVDTLILQTPSNTLYLSGYQSTNCQIILTKDNSYFLTDMRYFLEAKQVLGNRFEILCQGLDSSQDLICGDKIGFEDDISYGQYRLISKLVGGRQLCSVSHVISSLRDIKNSYEIKCIRHAQQVTELAFDEALKIVKEGLSEVELAAYIEYIMKKNNCQAAFESITAFGRHTASPHAHPDGTALKNGDFITMDIGARYKGYCSDMTRTVGYGQISSKQCEIYQHVLTAQQLALDSLKAGMSGKEGDAIARDYFKSNKLDGYFTHSLGHGVGIDIHEGVGLTPKEERVLLPDMVVTVEPGLYIDGEFGVRIEDMVLIKDGGIMDLTNTNKKLIIL
ncbi:MAG: aminopeptidase P family protein [Clostridia bacterium]|nr:aminopeptidase P family protein [Clostridia bacterium]